MPEPVRPAAPLKPRGKIVQVDHRYRYDYVDLEQVDSQAAYLQSQGLQGGGHSWEGIVYGLLALRSPETLRQIEFDADGDGIAIWSQEREPLEVVAHLVAQAKSDQSLLTSAIDAATRDNRME